MSSPVRVGGGVVFGPHPRSYAKKVSKSVKRLAFRKALSSRIIGGDVSIVESFVVTELKTKAFLKLVGESHRREEEGAHRRQLRRDHLQGGSQRQDRAAGHALSRSTRRTCSITTRFSSPARRSKKSPSAPPRRTANLRRRDARPLIFQRTRCHERAIRYYPHRPVDGKSHAAEREGKQVRFPGQPAREQNSDQSRRARR